MAREKSVSDEQIIAALLSNGTLRAAAAAVGLSERALYDRMTDGDFQARYKAEKAGIIRAAVVNINNRLQAAINTVAEIMDDENNNPAIRLQAAQTIINSTGKFLQRLQADEAAAQNQIESNSFFPGI